MPVVETAAQIRRQHFIKAKTIKEIARDLKVSRDTVRKVLRSAEASRARSWAIDTLTTSVDALLMVVLGGTGTLIGGAIGSAVVLLPREYLSTVVPWWQYVLGSGYVLTILYLPSGLMGIPQRIRQAFAPSANKSIAHLAPHLPDREDKT